jgi:hypothetical protein
MLLGLLDGGGKSLIVGLAADSALNVISAVARAGEDAAENIAGGAKQIAGNACHRRLKARHEAIAAFVATEAKLIPTIG